jgi:hypothetical protein
MAKRKKVVPILNNKTLTKKVREAIDGFKGEWTEDAVLTKVRSSFTPTEKDLQFLYERALDAAFVSAVASRSGPARSDEDGQIDWVGWENTIIRLGEKRFVTLKDAEVDHLDARITHIQHNALKIAHSAFEETERLKKVKQEMEQKDIKTAGAALVSLKLVPDPEAEVEGAETEAA